MLARQSDTDEQTRLCDSIRTIFRGESTIGDAHVYIYPKIHRANVALDHSSAPSDLGQGAVWLVTLVPMSWVCNTTPHAAHPTYDQLTSLASNTAGSIVDMTLQPAQTSLNQVFEYPVACVEKPAVDTGTVVPQPCHQHKITAEIALRGDIPMCIKFVWNPPILRGAAMGTPVARKVVSRGVRPRSLLHRTGAALLQTAFTITGFLAGAPLMRAAEQLDEADGCLNDDAPRIRKKRARNADRPSRHWDDNIASSEEENEEDEEEEQKEEKKTERNVRLNGSQGSKQMRPPTRKIQKSQTESTHDALNSA